MRRMAIRATTAMMALVTLAGCANGGDQPPVCDSLDAVRLSLDHVLQASYGENGLSQLGADLNQLKANLEQLATDAQAQFPLEVSTVRSAANQVAATVTAARADLTATTLAGVRSAVIGLRDSVTVLRANMSDTC